MKQVFEICKSKTYQESEDEVAAFVILENLVENFGEAMQMLEDDHS